MTTTGIVQSRKCPFCGHNEVGYRTEDGQFHPLRPGMTVQVMDPCVSPLPAAESLITPQMPSVVPPPVQDLESWVPQPVAGIRKLRMKFGVMLAKDRAKDITLEAYRTAYLEKIKQLIIKETHTPLAVLLDRYFTAPHLVTGHPAQEAMNLFMEIDEIRDPVEKCAQWLESGDAGIFFGSRSVPEETDSPTADVLNSDRLSAELAALSLESFFEILCED